MLSCDARVQRNGKHETIPTRDPVPGDIVILRAGDRVPADMRLIESHNLRVEEAILTGESTVVDKTTVALQGELPLGDRTNMVFSGTTISAGSGVGVVTATGQETELGHINQMMAAIEKHRTPLLVQMDKLGKAIFLSSSLAMMVALFFFSLALRDIPLGELLLSLISLAVAAVPEGLPAIISIILSLGVQAMARKRAIIRKLPTVETLGAMTVVCSDKTGTLTMNEMTVKAVITADCCYRVEGDSYEPQGAHFSGEGQRRAGGGAAGQRFGNLPPYHRSVQRQSDRSGRARPVGDHRRPDRRGAEGAGGESPVSAGRHPAGGEKYPSTRSTNIWPPISRSAMRSGC